MNSHETATPMHAPNFHPMTVLLNQRKRAIFRSLRASRGYVYPDGILRVPRVGAVSHNTPFVSTVSSDEWSGASSNRGDDPISRVATCDLALLGIMSPDNMEYACRIRLGTGPYPYML